MTIEGAAGLPPGLLIAAPASRSGKTTLTLGLLAAFRSQGVLVQPFKCGPDYIDPAFHTAASGRPSVNLDSWAMRAETLAGLAARHARGADMILAEGAMGLFDGVKSRGASGTGASADIAAAFGWPVLLILDVAGQAQTAGAVARGCASFRAGVRVAGVVLNNVASPRHLRSATEGVEEAGLPVLGALPRNADIELPERHLGLIQAAETAALDVRLAKLGAFISEHVDLARVRAITECQFTDGPGVEAVNPMAGKPGAMAAPAIDRRGGPIPRPVEHSNPVALDPPGQRIAVASDAAFSFMYPHVLAGWGERGAEILPFSPLSDEPPAADADAVWLPGGYPELHARRLAAAGRFLAGLRALAGRVPIHGECGGFMVLGDSLVTAAGERCAMAGLLAVDTSFASRRLHLGYRHAVLARACAFGPAGQIIRGHEFHYATLSRCNEAPFASVTDAGGSPVAGGARRGLTTGTFFHAIDRSA